ncbi:SusC/RagA family TonB-linked outer membrane protein [Flavobacterium sp. AS60]|uniref:SusC/RagA family TonB-linked outer membrane protein n=1 Tax=Flavobacterium anseongense TaxID=2910677 RepID=UPI001F288CCF|nr:SusC/RagA family TonB-linked outer membrane protein [Flavobacterium sp. AS60]MCF6129188.1 SusC/RagA family TonB-linked outer membrane protein [Flavobacterium sp. AS60]
MKTIYKKLLFLFLLLPFSVLAQSSLSGVVIDKKSNQPLPGVNVNVQGASTGTTTDFDGKFQLAGLKSGDKVVFSFIGYNNETITFTGQKSVSISLAESANELQEVVVQVGYGSVRKKDATGSVSVVSAKDFNKGAIVSADQLLVGKVAGVRITNDGGQPDTPPNIRIRGGASLSAQSSPLIIIDNVQIDNKLAAGQSNPLSLVNPNDIESFTILKDASATAIYGSRASNGVIIITTKRGSSSGAPKFSYSNVFSFGKVGKTIDVMNASEFTSFIETNYPQYTNRLGIDDPNLPDTTVDDPSTLGIIEGRILSNTNWQDAVFRTSFSQDHNFSVRAAIFGDVPFRASVGYNKTEGLIQTNDYSRISAGFNVSPTYLDGNLKVNLNAKGFSSKKNAIDVGAVTYASLNMDPTKPIYGDSPDNRFAGYFQETNNPSSASWDGRYLLQGAYNPVARLNQRYRPETIDKFLGNVEFDYKMPFLPELRAVVNLGMEASQSYIKEEFSNNALETYQTRTTIGSTPSTNYVFNPGLNYLERQTIMNKTVDAYLAYSKKLTGTVTKFEVQGGHNYQSFVLDGNKTEYRYNVDSGLREINPPAANNPNRRYYGQMVLESYFGRTNIDILDKYLFSFSVRADASSLFPKDNRWGYFPSAALAWKIKQESFLENSSSVNDLKLRLGYGFTGNSDFRDVAFAGYYSYIPTYTIGSAQGQYLPGIGTFSIDPYNPNLTWEKTATYNVGLDFDILKNSKLTGSIDAYYSKTTDLLALVNFPPGQFLTNRFVDNAGTLSRKGIEANLTVKLLSTDNMNWSLNGNVSYNIGNVDELKGTSRIELNKLPGIGRTLTYHAVGEQPNSAWVYEQVYDSAGHPVPDVFVDRNGDGQITDDGDKYYVAMAPNWTFGFGTTFNYKNFDFNASFRGQLGGNVYNSPDYQFGFKEKVLPGQSTNLNNALSGYLPFTTIQDNSVVSDYFIHDATFLRCESISLGYKFDKLYKSSSLRLSVGVNNLFILTKYPGQDPESFSGIQTDFYPRPRTFNMGVNIDF